MFPGLNAVYKMHPSCQKRELGVDAVDYVLMAWYMATDSASAVLAQLKIRTSYE